MFKSIFKKTATFIPKKYGLFNVETFNTWFNDKYNDAVYAHSGIFLRVDKLSESHIKDYLIKCHGLELPNWDIQEDISNFYEDIRKDWLKKLDNTNN
jgi:hypothetical protein